VELGHIPAEFHRTVVRVMRKNLLTDLPPRDVVRLQIRQRYTHKLDLTPQDLRGQLAMMERFADEVRPKTLRPSR